MDAKENQTIHEEVKNYYGKELKESSDLKTNACCTFISPDQHVKDAMAKIHDEVMSKYYGCGLVIPQDLSGLSVLDLGSGSGRDCYLISQLVGESGSVLGIDMTDEQLEVANRHIEYHRENFGYKDSNVAFKKGNIDRLDELQLSSDTYDIIVSNCVINLCANKERVLQECFRLLRPGGEMYFSDVYCNRRLPTHLQNDSTLYGECLSGALYHQDFLELAKKAGFTDIRLVEKEEIVMRDTELENKVKGYKFDSITYRLFKVEGLESSQEDYGLTAIYKGGIEHSNDEFSLDEKTSFKPNEETPISGNTYQILKQSRLGKFFDFTGDFSNHLGSFLVKNNTCAETTPKTKKGCC